MMPYQLDDIDVAIIQSLIKDGRKSFRQISREIKVSTPTVQARYERLVNVGLIKSISPIIDHGMLEEKIERQLGAKTKAKPTKITKNMILNMTCDLCHGPISGRPHSLKIADFERFFCCTTCRATYKEKYKGRIESLDKKSKF
jgi:Lrp/AsnC family leucine-responsive transcriptional regulator